jgi:hypothetical protein
MTEYVVVDEDGTEYQTYDNKAEAESRALRMSRSRIRSGSYHVEERKFAIVDKETGDVQEAIENGSVYDDEEKAYYYASVRQSRDLFNDYEVVEINPELFEDGESESEANDEDPEIEPIMFNDQNSDNFSDETESAEDNTDSNDTMYDFMSNGDDSTDDEQTATEEEESYEVRMWSLGNHSTLNNEERDNIGQTLDHFVNDLDSDVDEEVMGVLQEAQSMVDTTTLRSFECPVDECGLQHSHSDTKHDIRSAFNVEDDFADGLMFNPYCHCSVNELAMLMRFFSYINTPVFTDQADFEGVLEVEPTELNALFRSYTEDRQRTVDMAVQEVATERGLREEQVAPEDVREDLFQFFRRRQDIQNAANGAPIPQETRRKINDAEDELERMTNQ